MTTKELYENVSICRVSYGTHKVTIKYRGKEYTCKTHNTLATDRVIYDEDGTFVDARKVSCCGLTLKKALRELYDECKRANGLDY